MTAENTPPSPTGYFTIVLEGCDGSGTTSQIPRLACYLRRRGYAVATRAQPSKGPLGRLLRRFLAGRLRLDPPAQALLFAADRLHLRLRLSQEPTGAFMPLWPWRRKQRANLKRVLLMDRDVLSSLVYQGSELGADWLAAINRHSPPAELLLYFDVSAEVAASRRARRGAKPEIFDDDATQAKVLGAYRRLCASDVCPAHKVATIAADRPMQDVTLQVCRAVDKAMTAAGWAPNSAKDST